MIMKYANMLKKTYVACDLENLEFDKKKYSDFKKGFNLFFNLSFLISLFFFFANLKFANKT